MIEFEEPIVVLHDRFQVRGGGERVAMDFAAALKAPIVAEYWDQQTSYHEDEVSVPIVTLSQTAPRPALWFVAPAARFKAFSKRMKGAKVIVFSGSSCLAAAPRQKQALRILYCYTPPRFAFDRLEYTVAQIRWYKRPVFRLFAAAVRTWYRRRLKDADVVLCVSRTIQDRLLRHCGRESKLLYPGISLPEAAPAVAGQYYLSFARLDPVKRVRAIVEAFVRMPDVRLVVASAGSQEQEIRQLAAQSPNIRVVGALSDDALQEAISGCIATIYVPMEEDFGLTPLEAAALGKPTIGVAEGGLVETVMEGTTGTLLPPSFTTEDLMQAVRSLDTRRSGQMRQACLEQARRFGKDVFAERLQKVIAAHQAGQPR